MGDRKLQPNRYVVFGFTYFAYATLTFSRKIFSVVKTDVDQELGVSLAMLGWIDTGFLLTYSLGQLIIPPTFETWQRKTLLCLAFVLSAISAVGVAFAQNGYTILGMWIIMGFSQACVYPVLLRCLSPLFDPQVRGRMLGLWLTSMQVGALTSTFIGTILAAHFGWRVAFLFPAILSFLIGFGILYFVPSGCTASDAALAPSYEMENSGRSFESSPLRNSRGSRTYTELQRQTLQQKPVTPIVAIMCIRHLMNASFAYFFVKLVRYCMLNWLPYYFERGLDYSKTTARYSSVFFDVGALSGSIFAGFATDKLFGCRPLFTSSIMCPMAALSMASLAFAPAYGYAAVMGSVFFIGFAIAGPDSILGASAAQDLCERSVLGIRAITIAAGVVNCTGSLGAMMQGVLTTSLSSTFGWAGFFLCLVVGLLMSVLVLLPTVPVEKKAKASLVLG